MKSNKFLKLFISFFAFASISTFLIDKPTKPVEVKAEEEPEVTAVYDSIAWDNIVYDDANVFIPSEAFGDCIAGGAPRDGYVVLAFFKYSDGSDSTNLKLGDLCNSESKETMQASNFANKSVAADFKLNGISINDVSGAGLYIYPFKGLLFYLPHNSLDFTSFTVPTITLSNKTNLGNIDIEPFSLGFYGDLGTAEGWRETKDKSKIPTIPFTGVAGGWNNTGSSTVTNNTILAFGENTPDKVDYLKESHLPDSRNLVLEKKGDCGSLITLNGIPLKDIEGMEITYLHGFNYVYFNYPITSLTPSNGYKVTTFHIEEGCLFHDVLLGEVNLYLFNNEWQTVCPNYPADEDYVGAANITSMLGEEKIDLDVDNDHVSGELNISSGEFNIFFDYVLNTKDDSLFAYFFGSNGQNGIRVIFKENEISLFDSTNGNKSLGSTSLVMFNYGDWNSVLLYGKIDKGVIQISVAVDGITYIEVGGAILENKSAIGNKVDFYLGSGSASIRDAVIGRDIKKPSLNYSGKAMYAVGPNTYKIDLSSRFIAVDDVDGLISDKIVYEWEDDALTDDIINIGEWTVKVSVSDKAGNKTELTIKIICRDTLDVFVTFDGENQTKYKVGDLIAKPVDPTSNNNEEFVGWYHNDILWDFENDYVVSDIDLISKYRRTTKEYTVSVVTSGLEYGNYELYFASGTLVNVSIFEIDGYSLVAKLNDEVVNSFRVDNDLTINLDYTKTTTDSDDEKGCNGSISEGIIILSTICVALSALLVLRKKEEK